MLKKIKDFSKRIKEKIRCFFQDKKRWQPTVGLLVVVLFVVASVLINSNAWAKFYRTEGATGFSYGYGYGYPGYGYGYGYHQSQGLADYGYLMSDRYPSSATSSLTSTGITITVTRSYLSYVRVTYGTSSGVYTATTTYTNSTATSSNITLSSLTPNTTYYYRSQVKDIGDHEYLEQTEQSFVTSANPPASLSGSADSRTQITISWSANSNPSGTYYYAENTTAGTNSGWATSTSWSSSGLSCGTSYSFSVKARNSQNQETSSVSTSVSTQACATVGGGGGGGVADTTAPSISDIKLTVGDTYATISWKTNEASLSWIVYGTTTAYGLEKKTTTYVTSHSLTLTDLSPETTYHYQIKSKDSTGNIGSYTDKTFTTLALGEKPKEEVVTKPITEMTVEELRAEITRITALIKQLQAELLKLIGCTITSFERNLKLGMTGDDVKCLQIILNSDAATRLAVSGVGSPGNETNYFGPLTQAAVIKFQEKYADEVLASWGLTKGTGFVGSTTRAKLNQLLRK